MEDGMRDGRITRRELAQLGLGAALALGGIGLGARRAVAAEDALITELPENAVLVQTLAYVNESKVAGANCGNCALYLGGDAPKGRCGLFAKGVVAAAGHCMSWSKKSG
jgi:hypothetical protein